MWKGPVLTRKRLGLISAGAVVSGEKYNLHFWLETLNLGEKMRVMHYVNKHSKHYFWLCKTDSRLISIV